MEIISDEEPKSTSGEEDVKQNSHAVEIKSEDSDGKHTDNKVSGSPGDLDSNAEQNRNGEKVLFQ